MHHGRGEPGRHLSPPRRAAPPARAVRAGAGGRAPRGPRPAPPPEGHGVSGRALARAALLVLLPLAASARATPVSLREVRQGRFFHTADGGETWERQDAGTKRPFLTIACLDARSAWIAGK